MRLALAASLILANAAFGQAKSDTASSPPHVRLFEANAPIVATLTFNIGAVRKDKGDSSSWHPATITVDDSAGNPQVIPLKVRTRGIWRRKHCEMLPLRLNFGDSSTKHTVFHNLDKPKLTSVCRNDSAYEQYILEEFQLYRVYEQLSPLAPRVRLVRLTYADSANGKPWATRYAFISEEPRATADRLGGKIIEQTGAAPGEVDGYHDAMLGVFEYMIGNTDYQISSLHNVELLVRPDSAIAPIAFDFDFSGAVNAPYAVPDPHTRLENVRTRLFRGYCETPADFARVIQRFQDQRTAIYALYHDELGALMSKRAVDETLSYFDGFYLTISDPAGVKRSIIDACRHLTDKGTISP